MFSCGLTETEGQKLQERLLPVGAKNPTLVFPVPFKVINSSLLTVVSLPASITGNGFTTTSTTAVLVQKPLFVTVSVYTVVDVGCAAVVAAVGLANPVAGVHLYVSPPVAFNVRPSPAQIADTGSMTGLATGMMETSTVVDELQLRGPAVLLPVMV